MNKWLEPSTPDSEKYERMALSIKAFQIHVREKIIPALMKLGEAVNDLAEAYKKKKEEEDERARQDHSR